MEEMQDWFSNVTSGIWPAQMSLTLDDVRDFIAGMDDSKELKPIADVYNRTLFTQAAIKKYHSLMNKTAETKFFERNQEVFLHVTLVPLAEDLQFYLGCTASNTETVLARFWDNQDNALELLVLRADIERLLQHQLKTPTLDSPTAGMVRQALISAQQPLDEQILKGISLLRQRVQSLDSISSYHGRQAVIHTLSRWIIDLIAYRNEELDWHYFFTTYDLYGVVQELKKEIFPQLTTLGLRI